MATPSKPQGRKGPLTLSGGQAEWAVIAFPPDKRVRELMIAEMFVRAANVLIHSESPGVQYAPFTNLVQNDENDLDFTLTTACGKKLMELVEFAPLAEYGGQFKNAPKQLSQGEKSDRLIELIQKKSTHQGGPDRLLLIYVTEEGFWLDPISVEISRRALAQNPPNFERVYYVSPHNITMGTVDEIFPGKPHHICGDWSDEQLRKSRMLFYHPTEMLAVTEFSGTMQIRHYGECSYKIRFVRPPVERRQKS